jgi:putative membrane protein
MGPLRPHRRPAGGRRQRRPRRRRRRRDRQRGRPTRRATPGHAAPRLAVHRRRRRRTRTERRRLLQVITVPEDFSSKLASLTGDTPERATVAFALNDANGYLAGVLAATVELQLQQQINAAVYATFAKTIVGDLAELGDGLGQTAEKSSTLADNLSAVASGAAELDTGLHDLASGASEVSNGVAQLVDVLQPIFSALADDWSDIQAASAAADSVDTAATDLQHVYDALCSDGADADACGTLQELMTEAEGRNADVQTANAAIQSTPAAELEAAARDLTDLENGAAAVASGTASAQTGAADLASGLGELRSGAEALASSLAAAAARVPTSDPAANAANADVYGSPVDISESNLHRADTYGRGLAPFFIGIALWVFGLIAYLLLRPVHSRALAGRLSSPVVALGGWLPGALLGVVAALILYAALDIGLELDPVDVGATIAFCVAAVLVFTALAHLIKLSFGAAGSLLLVVLLMLQLTSAGGLYPNEVTPGFFQFLHPLLPMTYVVDGLRVAVSGGEASHLLRAVLVLAAYGVAALAASSAVVAAKRRWRMGTMKPHLEF